MILPHPDSMRMKWWHQLQSPNFSEPVLNYDVLVDYTCPYVECEASIIDNKCWKMILSIVEVRRVEVDILKMHQNEL